jgi:hypothetical protein
MPIYADATLGVIAFHVQHSSNGTWVDTTNLQTNQKYRFRACFKNFAPDTFDSPMFGPKVYVTDLRVSLKLPGAKFDDTGRDDDVAFVMSLPEVAGHRDFNDLIKPQGYLWAAFGNFTWIGPSGPVSQRPVDFQSGHREVRWVGSAPWARLLPT